jgi:hypothetical protein
MERALDPNATRRSVRGEAKKAILYSSRVHPQDGQVSLIEMIDASQHLDVLTSIQLPGYRKKAEKVRASFPQAALTRKVPVHDDGVRSDSGEAPVLQPKVPPHPRKKLKSLMSSSPPATKARLGKKHGRKAKAKIALDFMSSNELDSFVDDMIRKLQAEPMGTSLQCDEPTSPNNKAPDDDDAMDCDSLPAMPPDLDGSLDTSIRGSQRAPMAVMFYESLETPASQFENGEETDKRAHHSTPLPAHADDVQLTDDPYGPTQPVTPNATVDLESAPEPDTSTACGSHLVVVKPYTFGYEPRFLDLSNIAAGTQPMVATDGDAERLPTDNILDEESFSKALSKEGSHDRIKDDIDAAIAHSTHALESDPPSNFDDHYSITERRNLQTNGMVGGDSDPSAGTSQNTQALAETAVQALSAVDVSQKPEIISSTTSENETYHDCEEHSVQ